MPPLDNIRWERFCQNIVAGVAKNGQKNSQGRAYIAAGYNAKDAGKEGGSAEVAACRLLNPHSPDDALISATVAAIQI